MLALFCHILAALLVGGAGVFLILANDKGLGILLVLIAAVLARILAIDIPERFGR